MATNEQKVHYLKYRDTGPILEVSLKNPDETPFDLSGATAQKLHILLNDNATVLTRNMTVHGPPTDGVLRYTWIVTDWDAGQLIAGPTPPLKPTDREHRMEYEVQFGATRLTFPNDGYHTLRVIADIGQS